MENRKGPPWQGRPIEKTIALNDAETDTTSGARVQDGNPLADFAITHPIIARHFFGMVSPEVERADLRRRPMRADEQVHVRRIYWNCAAAGHRLPAELGLIVIDGGRL